MSIADHDPNCPNVCLFKDDILDFQQSLRDDGTLDQTVRWERLVDARFVDKAVKELGPCKS